LAVPPGMCKLAILPKVTFEELLKSITPLAVILVILTELAVITLAPLIFPPVPAPVTRYPLKLALPDVILPVYVGRYAATSVLLYESVIPNPEIVVGLLAMLLHVTEYALPAFSA